VGKYKWVRVEGGADRLFDVGILADGSLHNPCGYPEDVVRAAVASADARHHERRSAAAKKAALTRAKRQERKVAAVAKRILAGEGISAQSHCAICGRGLDDPESIARGVGSECWQDVVRIVERSRPRQPQLGLDALRQDHTYPQRD
jgi:hypothetical protein